MFSWLEKLEHKRWWNMLIVVSFVFAVLFGTKAVTIIDPQAGFLMSIGLLFVGIGEGANHKKVTEYKTGKIVYYDPFFEKVRGETPTMKIPKGSIYKREPIFIGILFDAIGIALVFAGIVKIFSTL